VKEGEEYYERTRRRSGTFSKNYYEKVAKRNGLTTEQSKTPTPAKAPRPRKSTTSTTASEGGKSVQTAPSTESHKLAVSKSTKCYTCGKLGHLARNCTAPKKPVIPKAATAATAGKATGPEESSASVTCFNCLGAGHISRDCTVKVVPKAKEVFNCYNCGEEGHLSRNCTKEKRVKRQPPTCYNCQQVGHLSHDCTAAPKPARQAQAYYIEVAGNGEGLRTCDREVKKGEKTRTGLVI
jgi:hypothetical protein